MYGILHDGDPRSTSKLAFRAPGMTHEKQKCIERAHIFVVPGRRMSEWERGKGFKLLKKAINSTKDEKVKKGYDTRSALRCVFLHRVILLFLPHPHTTSNHHTHKQTCVPSSPSIVMYVRLGRVAEVSKVTVKVFVSSVEGLD